MFTIVWCCCNVADTAYCHGLKSLTSDDHYNHHTETEKKMNGTAAIYNYALPTKNLSTADKFSPFNSSLLSRLSVVGLCVILLTGTSFFYCFIHYGSEIDFCVELKLNPKGQFEAQLIFFKDRLDLISPIPKRKT